MRLSTLPEVPVNSTFSVTVEITNVTGLNAASYSVVLGQSLLLDEGAEMKVFEGHIGGTAIPIDAKQWDSNGGALRITQSLSGLSAVSGDGFLALIELPFTWEVGSTRVIDFDWDTYQPVLTDNGANAIPTVWIGTTVRGIEP